MTDKTRGALSLLSLVLTVSGGGAAWGPGGAIFAMGLWLTLAIVGSDIEQTIKKQK